MDQERKNDLTYAKYLQSEKWRNIAEKRMQIDGYRCQECCSVGTALNPLEVHHLSYRYLYHEENRIYEDLVTLCHCCHKGLHKAMGRVTNEDGRKGWNDNRTIPRVHAFNITGTGLTFKEILDND